MMVLDEWPRAYVALTGGAVPGLRVVQRSDDPRAIALFGPFRRVARLRDAVRALAESSGLRDCTFDDLDIAGDAAQQRRSPLWFQTEHPRHGGRTRAPGCLRHDLGTCAGPCIGAGEPAAYRAAAAELRAFLDGHGDGPVQRLEQAMT